MPLSALHLGFAAFAFDDALFGAGHALGDVQPIFRRIEAAEVHRREGVGTLVWLSCGCLWWLSVWWLSGVGG